MGKESKTERRLTPLLIAASIVLLGFLLWVFLFHSCIPALVENPIKGKQEAIRMGRERDPS